MKISSVETAQYRIPLARTLSDSTHASIQTFDLVLVSLRTDEGLTGLGYAKTIADGSPIRVVIDRILSSLLVGAYPGAIDTLWHKMYWGAHSLGRSGVTAMARAVCDVALWDLRGKMTSLSLSRLLGGEPKPIAAYAGAIDLYFSSEELLE